MILLITPPFTQLNTPYPATAYLKGFLNTQGIDSVQMDLGLDVTLRLFTADKLRILFDGIEDDDVAYAQVYLNRNRYIATIDPVISFLQGKNPTLAYQIVNRRYLPEGSRFQEIDDIDWAFGHIGVQDKAKHLATLYLEDLGDFITAFVDPHFGFSRYAESISVAAHSFDPILEELAVTPSIVERLMLEILDETVRKVQPKLIAWSIPFPGNLFAALRCGQFLKDNYPAIQIAWGGGYPNTELRKVQDARVFHYTDYICLDDGEATILTLWQYINGSIPKDLLKRTLICAEDTVQYINGSLLADIKQDKVGTPDYHGLRWNDYISIIEISNPMHRLWNDGRWNKLTLAHGCYWGKCSFCDITLDYIKNYEATTASTLVDRMEAIISQTGHTGFHFVDEAAPPALLKAVAIEIIRRKLTITWWTNIRFEKSFTQDLCTLLAHSGCIAVSGGLEVASDRLLALMQKGVTVRQVAQVTHHFTTAGIMVHAYLMYGFPTQTDQETIDSLEMVRQLFESGVIQSGFWHQFAMTAHSPVGMDPAAYSVVSTLESAGTFAHNDLPHLDEKGCNHAQYSEGLKVSLYNYMHGTGFDLPLQRWFDFPTPKTSIHKSYIQQAIMSSFDAPADYQKVLWLGTSFYPIDNGIAVANITECVTISCDHKTQDFLLALLNQCDININSQFPSFSSIRELYTGSVNDEWNLFWLGSAMDTLRRSGLLVV